MFLFIIQFLGHCSLGDDDDNEETKLLKSNRVTQTNQLIKGFGFFSFIFF